jgi:transcription antitermination factor NusG
MAQRQKWYAIYTKPRWEKKVHSLLTQKGFESYCPLNKVRRQWSDRTKIIDEPLFKSYVFVRVSEEERTAVRLTSGVVNYVYWLGKPAIVRDREIKAIRQFLDEYSDIEVQPIERFKPGDRVVVQQGIFLGKSGIIKNVKNRTVEVQIESIGFMLTASFDKKRLSFQL